MTQAARTRFALLLAVGFQLWTSALALVAWQATPWMTGPHDWGARIDRVNVLCRWDSGWYLGIAEHGYQEPPARVGERTNHAFFPLYPLLMRGVATLTGLETSVAGRVVSFAAFVAGLCLFATWVQRNRGPDAVEPAVLVLVLFPTAFFFAAVYTESLVLFLSVGAVLAAQTGRRGLAALAGYLAGLTRITGVVLAPYAFLVSYREARGRGLSPRRAALGAAVPGLAPLLGFATFLGYFAVRFGDPFLFAKAQHNWADRKKTTMEGPVLVLQDFFDSVVTGRLFHRNPTRTIEVVLLVLVAWLGWKLFREGRRTEALYVGLCVVLVPLTGTLESGGRYVLPAFPAFAALAVLLHRHPAALRAWLAASAALQIGFTWSFVHFLWAG